MSNFTPPTREQVYAALFGIVSAAVDSNDAPLFKTKGRRLKSWDQVAPESKPAIYQLIVKDRFKTNESGMPYINRLVVEEYMFVEQTDDTQLISPKLTACVDAVVAALNVPDAEERQTLGDLVYNVEISDADYREGLLGNFAYAVMGIEIFTGELQPA